MTDTEIILTCAVRYALDRRTYVVSVITDYIADEMCRLSESCKNAILNEMVEQRANGYGDDCDEEDWMELKERLINSLGIQNNQKNLSWLKLVNWEVRDNK